MNCLNQILSIENNSDKNKKVKNKKMKNNGPIEINTILKFFAISILIFGISMTGSGSYSMYKESQRQVANTKPTIFVEETSETEITLQITHSRNLSKVTYSWNNEEEFEIESEGKKKVEEKIELPEGTNILNVYATDVNGQETRYQKSYTLEGNINIDIAVEGSDIKVTANGQDQLSYMTYRWDEEEEERVEINDTKIEQIIEIPKGLHTLTVIVVDINNETSTKEQEVQGVTKPKLEVTTDGSDNFIIKASDEDGIKRIEFIVNETDKNKIDLDRVLPLEQRKEFEYAYPLHEGENKLEVRVYNENDVSEVSKVLFRK